MYVGNKQVEAVYLGDREITSAYLGTLGSNVNPLPPENAIRFEGTNELIHFENDETEQYITFETI